MSDQMTDAILKQIWKLFHERCPAGEPNGDRIFTRWVDFYPDDPGWDDWTLSALVLSSGNLEIINDPDNSLWDLIRAAITAGDTRGEDCGDYCNVQWIRSSGDGPAERMSDIYQYLQ